MAKQDLLDHTVAFLERRDGIDKALKIIRYATQLVLGTVLAGTDSELAKRLQKFQSSIGTSRKAYRLGKFLADVDTLRKTRLHAPFAALEWLAAGGECVYYFTEQFVWLVKAGVLPERYGQPLTRLSNYGELVGYVGSISLSLLRISLLLEREVALLAELQRRHKAATPSDDDISSQKALAAEIHLLRTRRVLRTLGLVQDLADLIQVLADVRQSKGLMSHGAVLALAGLVSGGLSAYKNWQKVAK